MKDENKKMIKCPYCGESVDAREDFCPACLEDLPISNIKMEPERDINYIPYSESPESSEEIIRKDFAAKRRVMGIWQGLGLGIAIVGMILHQIFANYFITYSFVIFGIILLFIGFLYGRTNDLDLCPHCGRMPIPRLRWSRTCPHCKKRMW